MDTYGRLLLDLDVMAAHHQITKNMSEKLPGSNPAELSQYVFNLLKKVHSGSISDEEFERLIDQGPIQANKFEIEAYLKAAETHFTREDDIWLRQDLRTKIWTQELEKAETDFINNYQPPGSYTTTAQQSRKLLYDLAVKKAFDEERARLRERADDLEPTFKHFRNSGFFAGFGYTKPRTEDAYARHYQDFYEISGGHSLPAP